MELEEPGRTREKIGGGGGGREEKKGEREEAEGGGGGGRNCSRQFLGAEREQTLLSRLLGPFPFDPPSLVTPLPMLTLGLILFPSWAGAPGVRHGALGVTNACPRPGLQTLYQEHVSHSVPQAQGLGQGSPLVPLETPPCAFGHPALKHTCTHVTHTHTFASHAHTLTQTHRQHHVYNPGCPTTHRSAQHSYADTQVHMHPYLYPAHFIYMSHKYSQMHTHLSMCIHMYI